MTASNFALDLEGIIKLLPHRYPFLLIDRVLSYETDPAPRVQTIKNVTINEPFFQGHFPGHPVMPGVLIIEAMAQSAGILVHLARSAAEKEGTIYYLVGVDKARFKKTVTPGDQLLIDVTEKRVVRGMGQYQCLASVDGRTVAQAEILCAAGREKSA